MGRETKYYKASLDKLSIGISVFIFLLFGGIAAAQLHHYLNAEEAPSYYPIGFTLVFFVIVISVSWLLHPTGYSTNPDRITIHRPLSHVTFHMKDIRKVVAVNKDDMRWTARTFGNGGLFGYYGKFWNKKFGTMTWYATRRENYILLETFQGKKIVLTPDKKELSDELSALLH